MCFGTASFFCYAIVDRALVVPYQDTLVSLMNDGDFREIVGSDLWRRMDFIRKVGNSAAHGGKKVSREQAELCFENLHVSSISLRTAMAPTTPRDNQS